MSTFQNKNKSELIEEIESLKKQIQDYEGIEEERKQAEEALKESEKRFRQVAENAQEWIWEANTNGLYTYASPVVEKILGYKPEEIVGKKHFYDFFHPEDREEIKKAAFKVFAQKQFFREFVNRNVHKNGKTVWLSTSGVPILDEKGNLLGYRGADSNITERKQVEKTMRESEEKFSAITEQSAEGITVATLEGDYVFVNPAFCKMMGYSKEELLKMTVFYMKNDKGEKGRKGFKKSKSNKDGAIIEVVLQRKDKSTFISEVTGKPIRIGDKDLVLGIVKDITERNRAEVELREKDSQYRLLIETSTAGINLLDKDGNSRFQMSSHPLILPFFSISALNF